MLARLTGLIVVFAVLMTDAFADPPQLPRGKGEACVAPVDVMRKQHMDFLLHQRDSTVHEGIRTPRFSLVECVSCHVQENAAGEAIPVDAPDQFCEACHTYVSVKLDCFECHATTPDKAAQSNTMAVPSSRHMTGNLLGNLLENSSGSPLSVMSYGGGAHHLSGAPGRDHD
jgi:hypothetical protein